MIGPLESAGAGWGVEERDCEGEGARGPNPFGPGVDGVIDYLQGSI
jgi:hypothetical protein